jgi:hypothetical protein
MALGADLHAWASALLVWKSAHPGTHCKYYLLTNLTNSCHLHPASRPRQRCPRGFVCPMADHGALFAPAPVAFHGRGQQALAFARAQETLAFRNFTLTFPLAPTGPRADLASFVPIFAPSLTSHGYQAARPTCFREAAVLARPSAHPPRLRSLLGRRRVPPRPSRRPAARARTSAPHLQTVAAHTSPRP